jgi:uncharacterized protein YjbI with pentapeptide repeats
MTVANEEYHYWIRWGKSWEWNRWRKANPKARPNLSGANFRSADLDGWDLSRAYLGGASLAMASLHGANLRKADLSGAVLRGANLRGANLRGADLHGAYLDRANLSGADFSRANLSGVDLSEVDLSEVDLSGANLSGVDLSERDFSGKDLSKVNLSMANLSKANLSGANLSGANLRGADLGGVLLVRANLSGVDLSGRDFSAKDLSRVDLSGANLNRTMLVGTNLSRANLSNCSIYGIAAWNLNLKGAIQSNLIITPPREPVITVDNLQVAQFIYLLLNNKEIRHIIDTITSKVVLILGRFTPERKAVLDAMREELRRRDYLPILFDFEKPSSRDLTETISTLAHMARFVIADITDAKSIPQELERIVPGLPSVPVQPLIARSGYEYGMFEHFRRYPWVLETYQYDSPDDLLSALDAKVISPAESKAKELTGKK